MACRQTVSPLKGYWVSFGSWCSSFVQRADLVRSGVVIWWDLMWWSGVMTWWDLIWRSSEIWCGDLVLWSGGLWCGDLVRYGVVIWWDLVWWSSEIWCGDLVRSGVVIWWESTLNQRNGDSHEELDHKRDGSVEMCSGDEQISADED